MYELITNDTEGTAPEVTQSLDELARDGARRMIAQALQFEVDEYIEKLSHLRNERGNALVVRNGKGQDRCLICLIHNIRQYLSFMTIQGRKGMAINAFAHNWLHRALFGRSCSAR